MVQFYSILEGKYGKYLMKMKRNLFNKKLLFATYKFQKKNSKLIISYFTCAATNNICVNCSLLRK